MKNTVGLICVIAFLSTMVSGCPESSEELAIDDVSTALRGPLCQYFDRCLPAGFGDIDCDGIAAEFENNTIPRWKEAVAAGTAEYHADKARACVNGFATLDCFKEDPDICDEVFTGKVEDGGACNIDEECGDGSTCITDRMCPGECLAIATLGGDCSMTECDEGLTCYEGACVAERAHGETCDEMGMYCGDGLNCVNGTCAGFSDALTVAEGEPCDFDSGMLCVEGLSCVIDSVVDNEPDLRCRSGVASGEVCKFGGPTQCPSGEYCAVPEGSIDFTGKCTALPTVGADCIDDEVAPDCALGLRCDESRRCREYKVNGESCASGTDCYSGECSASVCVAPRCD